MMYWSTVILYVVLFVTSSVICYGFYNTRNGYLRKLLIWLFAALAWMSFVGLTQTYWYQNGIQLIDWSVYRIVANAPLAVIMVLFTKYSFEQ